MMECARQCGARAMIRSLGNYCNMVSLVFWGPSGHPCAALATKMTAVPNNPSNSQTNVLYLC
eukprot:2037795-Pyramimonas_sp.AAC.1